jgi:MFS family permease
MAAPAPNLAGRRFGSLVAAIATIVAVDIGTGLTLPILALILEARGVEAWLIGLNAAMAPLGIIVFGPFMPGLAARWGAKRMAVIAMISTGLILLAYPAFPSLGAWFVLRFLHGIVGGTLYSLSEAWILHFSERSSRGRVSAVYASILSLGFSFGPFLIPVTGIEGYLPFALAAGFVCLSALPLFFVQLDDADFRPDEHSGFAHFIARAPLLLFAVGVVTIFDSVMLAFYPIYGLRSGLDLRTASWILALAIVGNAFLQYPIGWLADRWSRMGVVWCASLTTFVIAATLPLTIGTWLIWPASLFLGSSAFAVYTIALAVLGDRFAGASLIAGSAAFAAMWGVGGIIGPPIAGLALDAGGPHGIAMVLAGTYALLIAGLAASGGRLVRG